MDDLRIGGTRASDRPNTPHCSQGGVCSWTRRQLTVEGARIGGRSLVQQTGLPRQAHCCVEPSRDTGAARSSPESRQ